MKKFLLVLFILFYFPSLTWGVSYTVDWSHSFGGVGNDFINDVAVDSSNNVIISGRFCDGTINFGGDDLTNATGCSLYVAKFSSAGIHQWSRASAATYGVLSQSVAVDSSSNIFVAGYFSGVMNLGGTDLTSSNNSNDIFLVKYNSAGVHQWSQRFGSTADDVAYGVATDSSGNVIITGFFTGTVNFGGDDLTSYSGGYDLYLAKYNSSGTHQWSEKFLNNGGDKGYSLKTIAGDAILFGGVFTGSINLGCGVLTSAGLQDMLIAKFGSDGTCTWSVKFGGTGTDSLYDIAVDSSSNVYATGDFNGAVNFGGGVLTSVLSDIFVLKVGASDGAYAWATQYGSTSNDHAYGIGVDASNNVLITGDFAGTVDFGGGNLASAGSSDGVMAVYLGNGGSYLWANKIGSTLADSGKAIIANTTKSLLAIGEFYGTVSFQGQTLISSGGSDVYLVQLDYPYRQMNNLTGTIPIAVFTNSTITATLDSITSDWLENSYGQLTLDFDVFSQVSMPSSCIWADILSATRASQDAHPGYYVYLYPNAPCNLGVYRQTEEFTLDYGIAVCTSTTKLVMAHEMGHALGANYYRQVECDDYFISDNCTDRTSTVLGDHSGTRHVAGGFKDQWGWTTPTTVSTNTTVELSAYEATGGLEIVRVPISITNPNFGAGDPFIYIYYRNITGIDISGTIGVYIDLTMELSGVSFTEGQRFTQYIPMYMHILTVASPTRTYTHSGGEVTITLLSMTSESASVSINTGTDTVITTPSGITIIYD